MKAADKTSASSRRLPSLTNLNVEAFPFERVLPRLASAKGDDLSQKQAVVGKKAKAGWDQVKNYLGALNALGLRESVGGQSALTIRGKALAKAANLSRKLFLRALAADLLKFTPLGLLVHVLKHVAPTAQGKRLKEESIRVLQTIYGVSVPDRFQLLDYTFKFLRDIEVLDERNVPRSGVVRAALGSHYETTVESLASLTEEESLVLLALLEMKGTGWVGAEAIKHHIRTQHDRIVDAGLGAGAHGKKLAKKKLVQIKSAKGKGARNTQLRIANAGLRAFLESSLARVHIVRPNYESGALYTRLRDVVATPMAELLLRAKGSAKAEELEVLAARIAFGIGCRDITIRSRQVRPGIAVEGERDVLARIDRPFPYRLMIQCKAHEAPVGTGTLYREIAIAQISTQVRTILFFSSSGYTASVHQMQHACLAQFPWLTIALFDGRDMQRMSRESPSLVVHERLDEIVLQQRDAEDGLTPVQVDKVMGALKAAKISKETRAAVMNRLWPRD